MDLTAAIREHGLLAVGTLTLLESMGLPAPGESAVIAAAIYAAQTHQIGIGPLIAAAASGAIVGDNIGYLIGRKLGYRLLARLGPPIGLTEARLRLGRYLFQRYGGSVVFFGRFVAIVRTVAALLAGANYMEWKRFLFYNALGGIAWTALYGGGAYLLGREARQLETPVALGFGAAAIIAAILLIWLTRKRAHSLQEAADRAFPPDSGSEPPPKAYRARPD
jgi:membrane protein DedA with SNARE-associated domain